MRTRAQAGGTESGERRKHGGERMKDQDEDGGTEHATAGQKSSNCEVQAFPYPFIPKRSEENQYR